MDSLSQLALGAAVGVAVMGPRRVRRAAAWGAALGTLPDLDVLVPYADAIDEMVKHRAHSHAFFWHLVLAPLVGWLIARLHREPEAWPRWSLMAFLTLSTHALLDAFTVYGTQLWLPFTSQPVSIGSIFIIDPLYTLPLLMGLAVVLISPRRVGWNALGLGLSSAYLAWSLLAQGMVTQQVKAQMAEAGLPASAQMLVTPAPFNTLLWRVVMLEEGRYHETWISLLDAPGRPLELQTVDRGAELLQAHADHPGVRALTAFSGGFVRMEASPEGRLLLSDLRMGREPHYFFRFDLGTPEQVSSSSPPLAVKRPYGARLDRASLDWLVRRAGGG